MPSFQATLQRSENGNVVKGGNFIDGNWVAAYFSGTNGSRICLGGPSASGEMVAFLRSLKKGQTYTLPDVFVAFQKAQANNKQ